MRKFPAIEQLRHVVAAVNHRATYIGQDAEGNPVYDDSRCRPKLTFTGTVKLHGSNAGVEYNLKTGQLVPQSRERVLTVAEDNHGFARWTESLAGKEALVELGKAIVLCHRHEEPNLPRVLRDQDVSRYVAYGEWCGPDVNAKTAIGQLPERWVLFSVLMEYADGTEIWLDMHRFGALWSTRNLWSTGNAEGIDVITNFKTYGITIDFNKPAEILDVLEQFTLQVEDRCPVAAALGLEGMGEGIVWECRDPLYGHLKFKTKGLKHKGTRNSKLVDIAPEVLAGREAFTMAVLTESRLEQGLAELRQRVGKVTMDHVGEFLKWVGQDVIKEESDTLAASGLTRQDVMSTINRRAKDWLMPQLAQI
ncbi:uncharacterized protein NMK_2483 [Novimethylophilus kurashikiensis]|uniref:RNA ligase domain-containing protein n=1 Tax=Novimethylophilus kurashikiensis TaxID=1825523 RepID=A0A2R5F9G3_9PROT|nr:RNA ligase family protein [Novimethylophilus kurashikiensis]GBG14882.1 uncharacterized protein NMK_2483 [Novimethylophilus kurashikiensis]